MIYQACGVIINSIMDIRKALRDMSCSWLSDTCVTGSLRC